MADKFCIKSIVTHLLTEFISSRSLGSQFERHGRLYLDLTIKISMVFDHGSFLLVI